MSNEVTLLSTCGKYFSTDPPSIFPGTKSFNITEGEDIELECRSDGHPPPIVTWKRIGGLTADITFKPGQRLTIKNASRSTAGDYLCTASNGIGDLQASTLINVNVFCKYCSL